MGEATDHPEDEVEMSFFEHLGELRKRLMRALVSVLPAIAVCWLFKEIILAALMKPWGEAYTALGLGEPQLHFANPVDPFVAYLVLSAVAGLIIASPMVFWQLWAFIAPGLYMREKRLALPFVVVSTTFFIGGVAFGYEIVLPMAFQTFLEFGGAVEDTGFGAFEIAPTIMIMEYLSFATRLLLAFGLTFEVPVVVSFLSFAGVVNWKQLVTFSRWWLLISTVLAAFLTPPDVGSQLMMLVPLNVLYWISIGLAYIFGPKVLKDEDEDED